MRRSRDSVGAPAVDPNNSSNNNNNNPIEFHPSSSPPAGALHISSSSSSVPLLFKSGGGASAGPATTGTLESIWDLYSVEGDARASLEALRTVLNTENAAAAGHQSPSSSLAVQYNSLWLSQLAASSGGETATTTTTPLHDASPESPGALLSKLQVLEASILQYHPPSVATVDSTTTSQSSSSLQRQGRYLQRNATILAYNRALLHWAQGDIPACVAICATTVTPLVDKSSTKQQQQQQQATSFNDTILCIASCRLAMLWLECILLVGKNGTMSADNSHATIAATTTDTSSTNHVVLSLPLLDAGSIVAWLEHSLANSSQSSSTNHITNTHSRNKNSPSSDAFSTEELKQLKFLLPVYKSRLFLAEFDDQGKRIEACIRSARKDMKTAMEVFQNKLRPAYINNLGEVSSAGSVTSLNNSEDGMNTSGLQQHSFPILERTSSSIPSVSGNIVLQKLNQSALVVKAHLEQLKGNTKKSLVLCSEAMSASDGAAFEPLRMNNLAVVYETNNRRYLALHALVKSLRAANPINGNNESSEGVGTTMSSFFQSDGTANPDLTPSILYNTAVCALRARNYVSAYECMAACLSASPIFANRPKCWLRLAEACLGIASNLKKDQETNQIAAPLFSAVVNVDSDILGIALNDSLFRTDLAFFKEDLVADLGSQEDMYQVKRNPLLRARATLEAVVRGVGSNDPPKIALDALISARLSLSYVNLAMGEYRNALDIAKAVMITLESYVKRDDHLESVIVRRLQRQQLGTCRMYASEACFCLGDLSTSMFYLIGDGKDDAFNRLASDLSGVPLNTPSAGEAMKQKLIQCQSMVRSSACVVAAAIGNHKQAKDLAYAANALEGDLPNPDRSSARQALIYSLICEENQSSALSILLSARSGVL